MSRREFLSGVGAAITAGTSGCVQVFDTIGNVVFRDVNIINNLDSEVRGRVRIENKEEGDSVLATDFSLPSVSRTEEDKRENPATFSSVWAGSGEYKASITIKTSEVLDGIKKATSEFTISDPEEQNLGVIFGPSKSTKNTVFSVFTEFSEIEKPENLIESRETY